MNANKTNKITKLPFEIQAKGPEEKQGGGKGRGRPKTVDAGSLFSFYLPEELHQKIKTLAQIRGISKSAYLREMIERHVDEQ